MINACITAVQEAAERQLSDADLDRIFSRMQGAMRRLRRDGMSARDAAVRAGQEIGGEIRAAAIIDQRNAGLSVLARQVLDGRVQPGREAQAVREVLTGVERGHRGAADSIDAQRHGLRDRMLGGLIHDLRIDGLLKVVTGRSKALDHDIAVELWALSDPASARPTGNVHAVAIARTLNRYQEALRGMLNDAGAWIGKLDHYITRQSHDQMKVRGAGKDADWVAWRDFIGPRLDERTFEGRAETPAEREQLLRNVWLNLSSGLHEATSSETLAGFQGPGNLAKRASAERLLHFKDPDAWWEYNQRFGKGAVIDSVFHAIESGTRDVALMRALGTNPEAMYRGWVDTMAAKARDRGDMKAVDSLKNMFNDRILDVLTGKASIPANATLAQIGGYLRVMEQLSRLGGVLLSSFPDLSVNAAMLRHNGVGIFESFTRQMIGLMPKGDADRDAAEILGVGIDHLIGGVMHRFQADDGLHGKAAAAAQLFYKLNGLTHWTDSLKSAAGLMLSNNLARRAGQAFDSLPARMQTSLRRYGIEEAEWDAVRAQALNARDGRDYVLPAHMADPALAAKVQAYISDQVREGMTEPTAYGRAWTAAGTQRGTPAGELVRTLNQFKQYAMTYIERSLGREVRRNGIDAGGLAHLIVATTALGYLAMTLKELAKGRNPREPQKTFDYAKLVMAAMVQGGGAGIFGDFLFGDSNRMGGGFIGTLAGPAAGTLEDVRQVLMAIRDGQHPVAQGIQALKNNAPYINLFYTRAALDYLIFYRMQEWANPGYLRRYEQNVKNQNNQTFWLSPSSAAR